MNRKNKIKSVLNLAIVAMVFVAASANAATMSASITAPDVGALDIANYNHTGNLDKWFCLPGEWASLCVGQTFTTGDVAVKFNAITYQISDTQQAPPTKIYTIRVCTVDRSADPDDSSTWVLTEIYSETCTQDVITVGNGEFMTWTFDTPVLLAAGTEYGIDVGMNSSTSGWEDGISYIKYSTADEYTDGTRYWSGLREPQSAVIPGVGDTTMSAVDGDRVFHIDLLYADPNVPTVDAGDDWVTWIDEPVLLDPTVENNDTENPQRELSYFWTAEVLDLDPNDVNDVTVEFDEIDIEVPEVTITIDNPNIPRPIRVELTLTASIPDTQPMDDSVKIDVYDDNCAAALGNGAVIDPGDFDADCNTDLDDLAQMAAAWLDEYELTEPVEKP